MGTGNSMGSQMNGGTLGPQTQTICGILNPIHQCNPNDSPCH